MQAHAALRAIRKALQGHQAGPGLHGAPKGPREAKRTPAQARAFTGPRRALEEALARALERLRRYEELIEKLRELASADELDTVQDPDAPSPYESALELQHRARVRATVEATKAKLRAALDVRRSR